MSLDSHTKAVLTSLSTARLSPGSTPLIPTSFIPTTPLKLAYGSTPVALGNYLKTSQTLNAPSISFTSETSEAKYTLLLVDPDAPTPEDPKFAYWRHWIVSGLQGNADGSVTENKLPVTAYLGPGAKDEKATPHRYVFLLFREPEAFVLEKNEVGGKEFVERRAFKAAEFVEGKGLMLVGVNWFWGVGDGWKGEE